MAGSLAPSTWCAALALALALCCYLWKKKKSGTLRRPPLVPGAIPFIGHVVGFDRKQPHVTLTEWGRKYGPIFRFRLLNQDVVVVSGPALIRSALVNAAFAGRPSLFRIQYGFHNNADIIFGTQGDKWAIMKRVATQSLRQFAVGNAHVDDIVTMEMKRLVENFQERKGPNFDPTLLSLAAVVNAITATLIGRTFQHDGPEMTQYKLTTRLFSRACSAVEGMELDMFPWLRFLPNETFSLLTQSRSMLDEFVDRELDGVKERFDPDNLRCSLDALLKISRESENLGVNEASTERISEKDVRAIFIDILVSGTLTTAIALNAFFLLMAHHPEEQARLAQDIEDAIGCERLPSGADRLRMPRMEAAILELLRYISHVPLNLPHYTLADTDLGGYHIQKDTQVLLNLWSLHHDVTIWDEPWLYRPGRFLDELGNLLSPNSEQRKYLLPFSGGRRMCIGETLARERLFLYAACILQEFEILPAEGDSKSSSDPRNFQLGLILEPNPFSIRVVPRRKT